MNKQNEQNQPEPEQPVEPTPQPELVQTPAPDNTKTMVVLGFISGALGMMCCPIFAIAGIIFGVIAQRKGSQLGIWIIVLSALSFLIGIFIFTIFTIGAIMGFNSSSIR